MNMKKKIVYILPVIASEKQATWAHHAKNLAKEFVKQDQFDFIFLAPGDKNKEEIHHGFLFKEFKTLKTKHFTFLSIAMIKEINKINPQLIHIYSYNSVNTLATIINKKPNQKIFLNFNSSKPSTKIGQLLWIPFNIIFRLFAHRVDEFITISEFEDKYFQKILNAGITGHYYRFREYLKDIRLLHLEWLKNEEMLTRMGLKEKIND